MIAAKSLNLTIDGKAVPATAGQTVLDAATAAGIFIPALCHHQHLPPLGACRLCLVEIDQQRALQPACTFPAAEGLVIHTQSPKVLAARTLTLQMLFSEQNHYCMYCTRSGSAETSDCELQKLSYDCGMSSWTYPPDTAKCWPVDATHRDLVLDHSRCVLCRRCVRACDSIAANHTLGVHFRGAKAMIAGDDPGASGLGESSCISCGICTQVCPTGALTDRRSAYAGHDAQGQRIASTCMGCAVGCGIQALVRDNHVLRIDGDWDASNGGLLCDSGRFRVFDDRPPRILEPLLGRGAERRPVTWDQALAAVAQRLKGVPAAGLASPRLPNEPLAAFACFFQEVLMSGEVALLYGETPPLDLGQPAVLAQLAAADCVIVIGGEPLARQKVVGYLAKRACDSGARLALVDGQLNELDPYAVLHLQLQEISAHTESPFAHLRNTYHLRIGGLNQLRAAAEAAQRPVVLYSSGLSSTVYAALRSLPTKTRFLPLVTGSNARGAAQLGLRARAVQGEVLYALLADELPDEPPPPAFPFLIVQAAYESAWTAAADIVLPGRLWAEQAGHVTNLEGQRRSVAPLVNCPPAIRAEDRVLLDLAARLGCELAYEQIPGILVPAAQGATP